MAITTNGIGSGLDINSLVSRLVAAEADPVNTRLNSKQTDMQSKLSAFGRLKSALSAFETSFEKLKTTNTFRAHTASSSDKDVFTASANSDAVAGNYNIEVMQLAANAKMRSGDFATSSDEVGTGTLAISLGSESFSLNISSPNNTLSDIRDAINSASDNPGITASLINVDSGTQLVLTAKNVGASNAISVTATDDNGADGFDLARLDSSNLITLQSAADAIIQVDGQQVTRSTNNFSDVIAGLSINISKADPGNVKTLSVTVDKEEIKKDIKSFVTNYSTVMGVMKGLSNYDAATGVAGALNGDSVVRGIESRMREAVFSSVSGGSFTNLSEIGIRVDDKGGLEINEEVLDNALNSDLAGVEKLFSSETTGIAAKFSQALSGYTADDGILSSRSDSLKSNLEQVSDDRAALTRRMASYESRLKAQFTAMDTLVASLQSTGSFLTSQLANLPKPNSISS